jgi:hypothetical protein
MLAIAVRRYHETGAGPEEANAEYDETRAAHEREASASGVGKLEHEAERLVTAHLAFEGEVDAGTAGGWRSFLLTLEIAPGLHLQANPASEPYLVATEVTAADGLRNVRYPAGEPFASRYSVSPIAAYSGRVEITGEAAATARLSLTYQACDEVRCLPPVTRAL